MPGLFGIISKKPELSERYLSSMARRMADSMRRLPWLREEIRSHKSFCGGRIHLGVLNPQPQPFFTEDKLVEVWVDGDLYPPSLASMSPPTAETLSALVDGQGAGLSQVDGVFAMACYNAKTRELVLANDRLGFRQLYYTETDDWFAYASEVKALLAIRDRLPELDEVSLRQFFGFDHMFGERTWWKGIELVPPASVWRISAQGRKVATYWTFDEIRRDVRDPVDAQTEIQRLWSEDVRRHSKQGRMPLLLSGGMDSRLLLAELCSQGADLAAITFGTEKSVDMKLARLSARVARVPHRACVLSTKNWWQNREETIWQTDGLLNGYNYQVAIALNEMHTGNWYSPMNLTGDLLFGGSHLDRGLLPDWQASPEKLLAPRYFVNPFFEREDVLSVSLGDASRYMLGPSSDCFHLRQRLRRFTLHGARCLGSYCEVVFPGLSHSVLKLVLGSLSDEQRMGHKFYNPWLVKRHPQFFADIPWQETGRGLAESVPTRLARSLRGRVQRFVNRGNKVIASDQWFVNYPECVRQSKIRDKLLREDLMADIYLRGAARRALADDQGPPMSARVMIGILTLETYLRQVAGIPKLTWQTTKMAACMICLFSNIF